jgi:hypothetical protein
MQRVVGMWCSSFDRFNNLLASTAVGSPLLHPFLHYLLLHLFGFWLLCDSPTFYWLFVQLEVWHFWFVLIQNKSALVFPIVCLAFKLALPNLALR